METLEAGGYIVEFDRAATIAAYQKIAKGGADLCDCDSCVNFAHVRTKAFPGDFVSLLVSLGIDPLKEGEAYDLSKDESGLYLYGGWFHFVGAVLRVGAEVELNGCRYWFDPKGQVPQADAAFSGSAVSAIEFITHVPWVIERAEPDYSAPADPPGIWTRIRKLLHLR